VNRQVLIPLLLLSISVCCHLGFARFGRPYAVTATWEQHLGGEYFNIARAMTDGRGFSDPFGESTGPTAWMPPLYPTLLALLLTILRSRMLVSVAVLGLTHVSLAAIGFTVYTILRRRVAKVPPSVVVILLGIWVAAFNFWFFLITQDIWLVALAVNATLLLANRHVEGRPTNPVAWILAGGAMSLVSPALLLPFFVLVGYLALRDHEWRRWAGILAAVGLLGLPWLARNVVTFHQFIPVKGNLGYDAYLANVVDDDGIYDNRTLTHHPYTNSVTLFEYQKLGEAAFSHHYGEVFSAYLKQHRSKFLQKVSNRAIAASVYYRPIVEDERGPKLIFTRVIYALPLAAFVILALLSERHRKVTDACTVFCAAYLTPYVFIAFYARYWLALTPMFLLVIGLALDTVWPSRWSKGEPVVPSAVVPAS